MNKNDLEILFACRCSFVPMRSLASFDMEGKGQTFPEIFRSFGDAGESIIRNAESLWTVCLLSSLTPSAKVMNFDLENKRASVFWGLSAQTAVPASKRDKLKKTTRPKGLAVKIYFLKYFLQKKVRKE